jgi:hypothetical protein
MGIEKAIGSFVVSGMMLSMPSLIVLLTGDMQSSNSAVGTPANIADLAQNMQLMNIIVPAYYIMGIVFAIKGTLALKEYAEYGDGPRSYSSTENKPEKPAVKQTKVNIDKEIKIAKIEKNELIKDMFKKEKLYDYDFEDKDLNELGVQIQNKVKYLKGHSFLQKDMESLLMVENTDKEYLKVIHEKYIEIPFSKRGNNKIGNSPYSLTTSQLELLLKGLDEIENKIVKNNIMDQKANEIFLKQKVASM